MSSEREIILKVLIGLSSSKVGMEKFVTRVANDSYLRFINLVDEY